jgi:hypothetical protein
VGAGTGAGVRSGVGAGAVRDGATGDGTGWGCGLPAGALAAVASERRTLHSTRPQKAACGDRPPDPCIATIAAEPPTRTSPVAAHTTR